MIASSPGDATIESIGLSSDASLSNKGDTIEAGSEGVRDEPSAHTEKKSLAGDHDGGGQNDLHNERPIAEEEPGDWDSDEFASHQDSELVDYDW